MHPVGGAGRIRRLRRSELPVDTVELARFLLGKTLVHDSAEGRTSGRIVEVEAYVVGDAAAHAFRGRTPRNRSLFLERGHAYVYISYGMYKLLNVSGEVPDIGAGVLLRGLEPVDGIVLMAARRGLRIADRSGARGDRGSGARPAGCHLARGPGLLTIAMGVDIGFDGADLCGAGPLWLGTAVRPLAGIAQSTRIGLTKEIHRPLRFFEPGNPCVSGPRRLLGPAV